MMRIDLYKIKKKGMRVAVVTTGEGSGEAK